MFNARKGSAAQSCHADPLLYLCLRGKCMKLLHKKTQRKQPEKNKDKLPQFIFFQTTEMHSNQASLILPVVIKSGRHYYKLYLTRKISINIKFPHLQIKQNHGSHSLETKHSPVMNTSSIVLYVYSDFACSCSATSGSDFGRERCNTCTYMVSHYINTTNLFPLLAQHPIITVSFTGWSQLCSLKLQIQSLNFDSNHVFKNIF